MTDTTETADPKTLGEFWTSVHWPYRLEGSETTRDVNMHRYALWIEEALGHKTWAELMKPVTLNTWMQGLCKAKMKARGRGDEPLSTAYIHSIKATLSAVLSHAITYGYLPSSPMPFIRMSMPKLVPSAQCQARERCWTLEQARTFVLDDLLPLAKRIEVAATILMACRGGEIRASLWDDCHLDAALPFVSITKSSKARRKIGTTKTKTTRDVPLHPELATLLRAYRAHLGGEPKGLVFPRWDGEVQGQPSTAWGVLCAAACVPYIVFHGLRHTGATLYRAAGVAMEDIGAVMGHKGKSITDLYAPPALPRLAEAVTKLVFLGEDAACIVPPGLAAHLLEPVVDDDATPDTVREPATIKRSRSREAKIAERAAARAAKKAAKLEARMAAKAAKKRQPKAAKTTTAKPTKPRVRRTKAPSTVRDTAPNSEAA